jgi:hypothetical protein
MSAIFSSTTSSLVLPPLPDPPPERGWMEMTVLMSSDVSLSCSVMDAFSCRPNVSGASSRGRLSMYARAAASVPVGGA